MMMMATSFSARKWQKQVQGPHFIKEAIVETIILDFFIAATRPHKMPRRQTMLTKKFTHVVEYCRLQLNNITHVYNTTFPS